MTDPAARPILFSAPMVRALLDGRKTQTRRLVKDPVFFQNCVPHVPVGVHGSQPWKCPYGVPGDLLWVRETYVIEDTFEYHGEHDAPADGRPVCTEHDSANGSRSLIPHYRATDHDPHIVPYDTATVDDCDDRTRWRPSIFMPRWASRLTLEITDIRVERLQDISDEDAAAEGISEVHQSWLDSRTRTSEWCRRSREIQQKRGIVRDCADDVGAYSLLWEQLNGAGSWDKNPWVVALTFKVHQANVDTVLAQRQALEPAA